MFKRGKIIKLAIVDDHPIIAQGIGSMLANENDILVVGNFSYGLKFLSFLEHNHVDIVLLDISLPDINGMDLCIEIKKQDFRIVVLALSNHTDKAFIMQMLQNGASGYLLKSEAVDELKRCIDACLKGEIVFSEEVKKIITKPSLKNVRERPRLTQREKQILKLIAEGKTTVEIGTLLFLSPHTIETHRRSLMRKFEVKNSIELINIAKELLLF